MFNVFDPSLTFMARNTPGRSRGSGGGAVHTPYPPAVGLSSQRQPVRTVRQIVHSMHRYDVSGSEGKLESSSMLRLKLAYLYPADIRRLLRQRPVSRYVIKGGFDGRELQSGRRKNL